MERQRTLTLPERPQRGYWQFLYKYQVSICELHATPIVLAIHRWENFIKKLKNGG
jgi:hypothetical protein